MIKTSVGKQEPGAGSQDFLQGAGAGKKSREPELLNIIY